ncbi:hypothetical protein Kisp02_18140 [Kineosporia sp. NBRC 101731]|nr:hypothetical protein Kisp02_18140 [Kineosporia sp. NBRC 101731]
MATATRWQAVREQRRTPLTIEKLLPHQAYRLHRHANPMRVVTGTGPELSTGVTSHILPDPSPDVTDDGHPVAGRGEFRSRPARLQ